MSFRMKNAKTAKTMAFLFPVAVGALLLLPTENLFAQTLTGWDLVWSDEFTGTKIDTTKRSYIFNEGDPGVASYTSRDTNSYLSNGNLVIRALKETYNSKEYTSTQIGTKRKGDWKFCRIDVRAKLPFGKGIWPAIWMLSTDDLYGNWPRSGEIDIMENLGDNMQKMYTTLHYGTTDMTSQDTALVPSTASLSDSFYVYTMIWDPTGFEFYLNGRNYYTINQWYADNTPFPGPFGERFYLLLDLAVGGNWGGIPDNSTVFPQQMLVDYVRVYERATKNINQPAERAGLKHPSMHTAGNTLMYELGQAGTIRIELCTVAGEKIALLAEGMRPAGVSRINLQQNDLKQGLYICRFTNITTNESQSIMVMR